MAGQGPCDDYYGNVAPVPTLASQEPGGGATLPLAILPSCRAAQPRLSAKFDCWEMDGMQPRPLSAAATVSSATCSVHNIDYCQANVCWEDPRLYLRLCARIHAEHPNTEHWQLTARARFYLFEWKGWYSNNNNSDPSSPLKFLNLTSILLGSSYRVFLLVKYFDWKLLATKLFHTFVFRNLF